MALTRGDFREYDFNRMVVLFTMSNYFNNVMKTDIDVFPDKVAQSSGVRT